MSGQGYEARLKDGSMFSDLRSLRRWMEAAKIRQGMLQDSLKRDRADLKTSEKELKAIQEARAVMAEVTEFLHVEVQSKLTKIVNQLFEAVFDHPYRLVIEFETKANRQEAILLLERDGKRVDPMTSVSGGVLDVAAFGLRLAVVLMRGGSKTLVFDEPFRFLSRDRRELLAEVLEQLSSKHGVQIIMVTHHPEFELGKIISL